MDYGGFIISMIETVTSPPLREKDFLERLCPQIFIPLELLQAGISKRLFKNRIE
jgi:hypothetical protein